MLKSTVIVTSEHLVKRVLLPKWRG